MARPKKRTVDYFPHNCKHDRNTEIVEKRFGNNGYAFLFKLLELLGCTEGHSLDLKDEHTWEYLIAKTGVSDDDCKEILDLLAKLKAIDPQLWEQKIVWCQEFVDSIEDVYKKRSVDKPGRPNHYQSEPKNDKLPDCDHSFRPGNYRTG